MSKNPILTVKDVARICNVSDRTATRYIKDMLDYYKPKSNKITLEHYRDYFAVPVADKLRQN